MAEHSEPFAHDDPRDPAYIPSDDEWISEDDITALAAERDVFGEEEIAQAERILRENLPSAVHSIAKLARQASSETVRLNAAKYLVDRNLGKIAEPHVEEADEIRELLKGVTVTS